MSASKLYLKGDSNTDVFLLIVWIFKNTYFLEDLWTAGSVLPVRGSLFNGVASLTVWRPLTILERDCSTRISVNFVKFLGKFFCKTHPSNHFSHDVVFFLYADLWSLYPKINLFGGAMEKE